MCFIKYTCLNLDVNHELTLGGLLTLRMEGELLTKLKRIEQPIKILHNDIKAKEIIPKIWHYVFVSSAYEFQFIHQKNSDFKSNIWLAKKKFDNQDFHYHSFGRVKDLCEKKGVKPNLKWKPKIIENINQKIKKFDKKIVCLHLRNVHPFTKETSNYEETIWLDFLNECLKARSEIIFFLLGNDIIAESIKKLANVYVANEMMKLDEQLALVTRCHGFIGMASGICTAANFSDTPYVILKHPDHHSSQMQTELGKNQRFSFSIRNQELWRIEQSQETLRLALAFILGEK